jgi:ABC-type amino acid transport substrate-binding protein
MVAFLNRWIDLKQKNGTIQKLFDHWILGEGAEDTGPRWSIIRDVLHWVD